MFHFRVRTVAFMNVILVDCSQYQLRFSMLSVLPHVLHVSVTSCSPCQCHLKFSMSVSPQILHVGVTLSSPCYAWLQKSTQRWRPAPERARAGGTGLPDAVVDSLMTRDIRDDDYDLLLQLDR